MKIALIPLDDRPCNLKYPRKLVSSSNVEILIPPKECLGYFLDPGSPQKIGEWINAVIPKVDAFVISADMIAYGGLIASRKLSILAQDAIKNLEMIRKIKKTKPGMPVYLFNIIMRLSITADSEENKKYWENIFKLNARRPSEAGEIEKIKSSVPEEILGGYFKTRERNHQINLKSIELLAGGAVDYLALAKEDCSQHGIQKEEEVILEDEGRRKNVGNKLKILDGADEIAGMLVVRSVLEDKKKKPKVAVKYSSHPDSIIALYEDTPLNKVVSDHIEVLGCAEEEDEKAADIALFINSFRGEQKDVLLEGHQKKDKDDIANTVQFCSQIADSVKSGKNTCVADVFYANGADPDLVDALINAADISKLSGFAGWNTASNSIGSCLAQAVMPLNVAFLLERFIDDCGFQSSVRNNINEEIKKQGISPFNLGDKYFDVEATVIREMDVWAKEFFKKTEKHPADVKISLPWPRTFEIDCDIICS